MLSKRELLLLDCLDLDSNIGSSWVWRLPDFGLKLTPLALLILRPSDSDWNYMISSLESLTCELVILELLSLHNHMTQFLITKQSISLYMHTHMCSCVCICACICMGICICTICINTHTQILLALFLCRTLTNTTCNTD